MDLVEVIYEAAFVPELWQKALSRLAELSGSVGSTLFVFGDAGRGRGVTLPNLDELLAEFLASDTLRFSNSVVRMCELKPHGFVDVDTYLTDREIEDDPIRIRLRAQGIGAHVCTAVPTPSGDLAIYVLQRPIGEGYSPDDISRLDRLRPHLARAGLMAARLGLEHARGTVAALETLGIPAAVCARGRVLAANEGFQAQPRVVRIGSHDRVQATGREADALLAAALRDTTELDVRLIRSIPVSPRDGSAPAVMHVLPLRRTARDLLFGGDSLLVVTSVNPSAVVPSPAILSGLFDLTPAEAKLATSLAQGQPLGAAAAFSTIKMSTARSYLEQIFRKTGTRQQSQLVALLKSAAIVRTEP